MFTGIIEETGIVKRVIKGIKSSILEIEGNIILEDMHIGDSIAVNGVCLTVTKKEGRIFTTDVMTETIQRSTLEWLKIDDKVNLERAMAANGRFGGHMVAGHIDGTGEIKACKEEENAVRITITAKEKETRYIVEKGSIAIDGISLTVANVDDDCFEVCVIPHTKEHTTLLHKKIGDVVNIECDVIGKYIEKLMRSEIPKASNYKKANNINATFLAEHGFL